MAGLVQATAVAPSGASLMATLDPAWDIWGPAGGYLAAIALSAVRARAEAAHRPVTLTGQFVRVARPGRLDVDVTPVKSGNTALFAITLAQESRPVFQAQVWTTSRAEASLPLAPAMPDVPPPHNLRGQDELMAERGVEQIAF